jgi:hypothetical protein
MEGGVMGIREEKIRFFENQAWNLEHLIKAAYDDGEPEEEIQSLEATLQITRILLGTWQRSDPKIKRKPHYLEKGNYLRANEFNPNANWV